MTPTVVSIADSYLFEGDDGEQRISLQLVLDSGEVWATHFSVDFFLQRSGRVFPEADEQAPSATFLH